jgi:hypothetical protein
LRLMIHIASTNQAILSFAMAVTMNMTTIGHLVQVRFVLNLVVILEQRFIDLWGVLLVFLYGDHR